MSYHSPKRWSLALWLIALLTLSPNCSADSPKYYEHFRYAGSRFLPHLDQSWKRLTAQGLAESNLDENAVSPAGAMGVMQFMPASWEWCLESLNLHPLTPPTYAKASIICGGWLMSVRMRAWSGRNRTPEEQWLLALSDYNGGQKFTYRAQRDCGNARDWIDIEPCHPFKETRVYVFRVKRIFEAMP
jgi:membrane-bound lytic murein transglycosylase MltF